MERTVLVTGTSSGIGRATARAFREEDWTVYATARNPADIEALGERHGCELATLDVTDGDDAERVVDRIIDEQGRLDCVVNNAGYGALAPVEDVTTERLHRQFDVNVYGPHRLVRAALPHMREAGDGTVVNVSSVAGRVAFPGGGAYCGSKFALEAMSDALRTEVEGFGIDIVLVEPGPVDTGFAERAGRKAEEIDSSGVYDWFYDLASDAEAIGNDGPWTVTPETVAEHIVNAASATRPRARYPVGTLARVALWGRLLPDGVRDRIYGLTRRFLA